MFLYLFWKSAFVFGWYYSADIIRLIQIRLIQIRLILIRLIQIRPIQIRLIQIPLIQIRPIQIPLIQIRLILFGWYRSGWYYSADTDQLIVLFLLLLLLLLFHSTVDGFSGNCNRETATAKPQPQNRNRKTATAKLQPRNCVICTVNLAIDGEVDNFEIVCQIFYCRSEQRGLYPFLHTREKYPYYTECIILNIPKRARLKMFRLLLKIIWKKGIPLPTGYIM